MAKRRGRALNRAERFNLLYGAAGTYMSGLNRPARVKIKQLAAKQGVTVAGLLQGQSGTPAPLRERSAAGIRAQALKTINSAYAPAESELSSREAQVQALDQKRAQDNVFYRNWLNDQLAKASANAQASEAALLQQAGQLHAAVTDRYTQASQALQQQNAATPGNVSDPSQSNATLMPAQQKAEGAADVANAGAVSQVSRSQDYRATLNAANLAQSAAMESQRMADTWSSLSQVASDKQKLQLTKAADAAKEISRLLDNEVSKAQGQQNFAALGQKLGLQQATLNEKARHDRSTSRNAAAKLRHQKAVDRHDQMLADSKFKLDKQKYGLDVAKEKWKEAHPNAGSGGGGISQGQRSQSRQKITTINNAVSTIRTLIQNAGGPKKANTREIRQLMSMTKSQKNPYGGYEHDVINAAFDIVAFGRLGDQNFNTLKQEGVLIPKNWRPPGRSRRK